MKKMLGTGILMSALALVALKPALAQSTPPAPQPVVVVNQTRFQSVAQDVVLAAGASQRFEVRSDGFSRVSLLLGGTTTPGTGGLRIGTLYGPPLVPAGTVRALTDRAGAIRGKLVEPVLGPAMVVVLSNEGTADATITMSAYFAN
ncbi:MAG TPA: hypothetical protein VGK94_08735 [Candidatus Polarisedimenticolia bacterium]|jgi:hypothetical protein